MLTKITSRDVLIVIDVQNDFCPGGALAVNDGDGVLAAIHKLSVKFEHIVLTQDWHPADHISFASQHSGFQAFESVRLFDGLQTLWPDHCIQGSLGAELHPLLQLPRAEMILRKGFRRNMDSYSAFFENDRMTSTGLAGYLEARGLNRIYLAGLAYDYCVGFSALDARKLGLSAVICRSACRAISLNGSEKAIENKLLQAGVEIVGNVDQVP